MRYLLVLAAASALAVGGAATASAQTVGDSAAGAGTAPTLGGQFLTFEFAATSGQNGENATGTYSRGSSVQPVQTAGPVTCLNVQGNIATIGGPVTSGTAAG